MDAMMRERQRRTAAIAGFAALMLLGTIPRTEGQPLDPAAQAAAALHFLEGARYGEAIPAVQALVDIAPNDPLAYQLRGALEMRLGDVGAAGRDFATAARTLPNNPLTLFGQGLTQIWTRHWDTAGATLTQAQRAAGLSGAQPSDLATMQAYVCYLRGQPDQARALAKATTPGDDRVRQELLALISARTRPQEGAARLTEFLRTDNGVPRVREEEGLRPLFDPAASLEPAVAEPSLRQMFSASLRDKRALSERRPRTAKDVSGEITLRAPADTGSTTAAATFTIDGQLVGMVNTRPYEHVWQTADGGNGPHSVRIDVLDASGSVLSSTKRRVVVANVHPGAPDAGLAAAAGLEARVWNLLRLRPSRKAAEWTLGGLLAAQGDSQGAWTHRLTAAALDADYKDGRRAARAALGTGGATSPASGSAGMRGLWAGSAARRQVALTFDDGPNPLKTPALLDALDRAGVPATFFVVGSRAEAAPELVRRMVLRGDDVENHSYTHPNMAQTEAPLAEAEILRTSVVIRALTGKPPRFFRPPGGQRNPVVYRLAGEYGQTVTLWTIDALNYEEAGSAQGVTEFVLEHMQPGAIVLMHSGMDSTVAAIPRLVAALRAKGYQFVTLSQMTVGKPAVKAASAPK